MTISGAKIRGPRAFTALLGVLWAGGLWGILPTPLHAATPIWMIDPGHGGDEWGVVGCEGLNEAQLTLEMAQRLQKLAQGAKVYISRTAEQNPTATERATIANQQPIDLWISLHLDSAPALNAQGVRIYINQLDPQILVRQKGSSLKHLRTVERLAMQWAADSDRLASALEAALRTTVSESPVAVLRAAYLPLMGVDAPNVMLSLGFLSNPEDCARLKDEAYLNRLAVSVVSTLASFKRLGGRRR